MAKKTNCTINGVDYYRLRVKIGTKPDGKADIKPFYGKSKREAEKARDQYFEHARKNPSDDSETPFDLMLCKWFDVVKKPSIAMNSYTAYHGAIHNHILKSNLVGMPLSSVKSIDIQMLINTKSKSVLEQCLKVLNPFFKYCIRENLIVFNPMATVQKPKFSAHDAEDEEHNFLQRHEFTKLLELAKTNQYYFPFVFIVSTGLRVGEFCALDAKDVDLKTMKIKVTKAMVISDNKGVGPREIHIEKTKNRKTRTLKIVPELVPYITTHIKSEKKKLLAIGKKRTDDTPFVTNDLGEMYRSQAMSDRWARQAHNVTDKDVSIHGLRHTFCTFLCARGVQTKVAAKLLGHSNTDMVDKIYSHVLDGDDTDAVEQLSAFF